MRLVERLISQTTKRVVCGTECSGGWGVFLCHPIFFPPPPTIFVTILYIFFCSWKSPHEGDMFVYKVLHWS